MGSILSQEDLKEGNCKIPPVFAWKIPWKEELTFHGFTEALDLDGEPELATKQ